ncbi:peptidase MA superfamily [Desulfuromonas soudanensis]|uniref:Peptidase MA superfamily n=1 Tax=Desulfuromonas soudanensis TaxID=1603606 RepID=A0A0M4D9I8_9BACT|nr:M1 family aminopeptidase [Desulfuromonas soudanensis]ALC16617.1 peptidase MA superfamily [Desulfuromonas soudanensis]
MNWPGLLIAAIVSCFLLPVPSALASPTIRHLDLRLLLAPEEGRVEGTAVMTIGPDGASQLILLMAPQARIERVELAGHPSFYDWHNGRLTLPLPAARRREEILVTVRYAATFGDAVPESPAHSEDPTYGVSASVGPRGTFLAEGSGWYPELPGSRFLLRLYLEAPEGIEGVTSGIRVERGTRDGRSFSLWQTTTPRTGATLVAGPYRLREEAAPGIPVSTYFYPEHAALSEVYLEAAKGYLKLYSDLFGPYPFPRFSVVENFFPTGYGFPGWTLLGSTVVPLPFIVETSLGHEIAHSWWGNGVRIDPSGGNWSEGLTTYLADHLYKERSSAAEGREYRQKILRDYATLVPAGEDFPLSAFVSRTSKATQAIGYGKGAMVFHMARKRVGDRAFWGGLKTLATDRMFQGAGWDDFSRVLSATGHVDLRPFFRQWVEVPGAPSLSLEEVEIIRTSGSWTVTGTIVQSLPAYDLAILLRLETDDGLLEETVAVAGERTPFTLRSSAPPRRLLLDPEVDLFRRLAPEEIPKTVNALRGSRSLVVVTASGLPPKALVAGRTLLAALRKESSPLYGEDEVTAATLQGHDILCLGVPKNRALLPPLPRQLSLKRGGFTVNGQSFSQSEASLFFALADPQKPTRTLAFYLPQAGPEVGSDARKIPHYGNDSYLVFVGDRMLLRGTWETGRSPLIREISP